MITAVEDPRLFEPFLDVTDMVMCRPAGTLLAEINQDAAEHRLRFPLVCDPQASLRDHLATIEFAPNSARFGPYVDNIIGMNWELPAGRIVRIGERVIKSATGYDLQRFLLHSDGRYGRAVDYVLRLRPLGGESVRVALTGPGDAVDQARRILLRSPWIHWVDALDLCFTAQGGGSLELSVDCAPAESTLFMDYFQEVGDASGAGLARIDPAGVSVLPALSLKATGASAIAYARLLVREYGGSARVLCVNGVAFYYPPPGLTALTGALLGNLARGCAEEGGHLHGPWAPAALPVDVEAAWAAQLENEWKQV